MQIVKILERTKNRVDITLDSGLSFVLYKGELRSYKLHEGDNLSEDIYNEIFGVILPKRAKLRAMNLLKVRPYTEKALRDKLSEGGYPKEIEDIAIEYVKSYHYIDDLSYAKEYIYTYKDRKNKVKLKADLIRKGVSKALIEQAFEEELGDDGLSYEKEQILSFIRKKHYSCENSTYEEKMKLLASLARKGYSVELAKKLLDITSEYL